MTADELYTALTWASKPIPPARLLKAQARADNPEVWAEVQRRLEGYVPRRPVVKRGRVVEPPI